MWPGALVERSIFGTDDPRAIWAQVLEACPDAVGCFAFEASVGARFGLRLRDGSRIALKVHVGREGPQYLDAVQRVQKHLSLAGTQRLRAREATLFEATAKGAEWIDEIAGAAKPLRDARAGRLVIGHGDWTVKHFRFDGLRPTVVYDWDSLNTDFESVFVGNSAATFTYTEHLPVSVWPTVQEAQAFLDDYEQLRAEAFTPEERAAARAAAVYSRAYSARCTHAVGKDATHMQLREYAETFL
jgi:hypothetical protein